MTLNPTLVCLNHAAGYSDWEGTQGRVGAYRGVQRAAQGGTPQEDIGRGAFSASVAFGAARNGSGMSPPCCTRLVPAALYVSIAFDECMTRGRSQRHSRRKTLPGIAIVSDDDDEGSNSRNISE